jgi:hypothetical protein
LLSGGHLSEQKTAQKVPVYAARLLTLGEGVCYLTRPRWLPLHMLVFMAPIVLGVIAFSAVIEDPGFMRLLSIPAIPVLGGFAGYLIHSPVVLMTDRRIISARRFLKPLSLDLEKLHALRVQQNPLGRLLGYGTLVLLFRPPRDPGEGVFLRFELKSLPDAASLSSVILASTGVPRN